MWHPSFRGLIRLTSHYARTNKFMFSEDLDPQRVINRCFYGTDYDPRDVSLNFNKGRLCGDMVITPLVKGLTPSSEPIIAYNRSSARW